MPVPRLTRPPRVASARRRLRLSQAQLAAKVGITQGALSHVESGQHVPSVLLAVVIAKKLGVSVERLWGWSRPTPRPQLRVRQPAPSSAAVHRYAPKIQGLSKG